jgi:hypothetical protein
MARHHSLTKEQRDDEIVQYVAGNSCADIAEHTGRPAGSIRSRIKRAGVLRDIHEAAKAKLAQGKTIKATPALAAEANKLREKGWIGEDICKRLRISKGTLTKLRRMTGSSRARAKPSAVDTRIPYEQWKQMQQAQP